MTSLEEASRGWGRRRQGRYEQSWYKQSRYEQGHHRQARRARVRRAWFAALATIAVAAGIAGAQGLLQPANAQGLDGSTRPVRVVVPFGAGTTTDTVARVVGEAMGRSLGQTVIVENKSGSGGGIGTEAVARAAPDGHTLVMGTVGTHAINPTLYRKLGYDALRDFVPVAFVGQTPTLLVVSTSSPIQSLKDLAAAAAKGNGISFASAGNGTSGHLAGELLKAKLGGQMLHVPYKEGAQALSDVMSGQVQFMFYHPTAVLSQIKAGKLRALGASSARRSASVPDVPTIAEQIGSEFDLVAWFMLYAPAATPAPLLAKLRTAAEHALSTEGVRSKLQGQGIEAGDIAPADLQKFGQSEVAKWADLVRRSSAQVD